MNIGADVILVNLTSRPDRLSTMAARFVDAGMDFTRFPALTAADASAAGYRVAVARPEKPEWRMTDGAVGCAATHLEIYRSLVESDRPGLLIVEDDCVFAPQFSERAASALNQRPTDVGLVQLGWLFEPVGLRSSVRRLARRLAKPGPQDRLSEAPFGFGTHCYWISRECAALCLQWFDPLFAPVDAMLRAVTHYSSLRCAVHWPSLAHQDATASDIRTDAR